MKGSTNCTSIYHTLNDSLSILRQDGIQYNKVRLLVSDQAAYIIKVGRDMKSSVYPEMLHITCLAHALHQVCELIRSEDRKLDHLVISFKKVFAKCNRRLTGLSLHLNSPVPSFPSNTRWVTWLSFCSFLAKNHHAINEYVKKVGLDNNSLYR